MFFSFKITLQGLFAKARERKLKYILIIHPQELEL